MFVFVRQALSARGTYAIYGPHKKALKLGAAAKFMLTLKRTKLLIFME